MYGTNEGKANMGAPAAGKRLANPEVTRKNFTHFAVEGPFIAPLVLWVFCFYSFLLFYYESDNDLYEW